MGFLRLACSYDSIYNHQLHTRFNLGSKVMDNSNHGENVDGRLAGTVFFLLFSIWPKQPVQSKCTLALGSSGGCYLCHLLPWPEQALLPLREMPALPASCIQLSEPHFVSSACYGGGKKKKKKDDSCPEPPVGSTASVILLVVQVTAVKVPSAPRISRGVDAACCIPVADWVPGSAHSLFPSVPLGCCPSFLSWAVSFPIESQKPFRYQKDVSGDVQERPAWLG